MCGILLAIVNKNNITDEKFVSALSEIDVVDLITRIIYHTI